MSKVKVIEVTMFETEDGSTFKIRHEQRRDLIGMLCDADFYFNTDEDNLVEFILDHKQQILDIISE